MGLYITLGLIALVIILFINLAVSVIRRWVLFVKVARLRIKGRQAISKLDKIVNDRMPDKEFEESVNLIESMSADELEVLDLDLLHVDLHAHVIERYSDLTMKLHPSIILSPW